MESERGKVGPWDVHWDERRAERVYARSAVEAQGMIEARLQADRTNLLYWNFKDTVKGKLDVKVREADVEGRLRG